MVQVTFNTKKRSIMHRKQETGIPFEQMTDGEEPQDAQMKLSPVITNICISLLVVALLAVSFRL